MGKQAMVTNLFSRFLVIIILIVLLSGTSQSLSDKRLCADENCKGIISLGRGTINYRAGSEGMVSFKINSQIRIKSKSAGKDPSVWGVEVNGREGYAPKAFIQETQIYRKESDLKFVVDVVKPGAENPVLSTSENLVAKVDSVETTTTKPLEFVPRESDEKPSPATPSEDTKTETVTVVTPVLMELVDGTQVPKLDNDSDNIFKSNTESGKGDGVAKEIHINQNVKTNSNDEVQDDDDGDNDDDDKIGDYDEDEEEEENEHHPNAQELKEQFVQEDNIKGVADEKVENSLTSNDNFLNNQAPSKISEENQNNNKNENIADETVILNSSSMESSRKEEENENEKPQETILNHFEQIEESITRNEYENEKQANNDIATNATDVNNTSHTEDKALKTDKGNAERYLTEPNESINADLVATQEVNNSMPTEVKVLQTDKEDDKHTKGDFAKVNESFNANSVSTLESVPYIENANNKAHVQKAEEAISDLTKENEIKSENFENSPKSTNAYVENAVDSENEDFKEANGTMQKNLENNPTSNNNTIDNNTPLINISSIDNDTNINEKNIENIGNVENVISIKTSEEQEIIHPTTISPQVDIEENSIEINKKSLVNEMNTGNEEEAPQEKYSFITTSSNTFTEAPTNVPLSSQDNSNEDLYISSPTTEEPHNSFYGHQSTHYDNAAYETENQVSNSEFVESTTIGYTSSEPVFSDANKGFIEEQQSKAPSSSSEHSDIKENKGLFATIMGTVNSVLSINKKKHNDMEDQDELDRILFSKIGSEYNMITKKEENLQYCKQIGPNGECPHRESEYKASVENCDCSFIGSVLNSDLTFDAFIKVLAAKVLEISQILAFLVIVAAASLFFIFGYYCFCNTSREGALLSKLNQLESSLLASQKENAILKHNLMSTRQKLASIEDNSFGSNDMVVSLKNELEEELLEKARLQGQITALQKELENAADAGIELNKIVSELLSNQTGDESIISSVEELQRQLNEQQNTILEINASLAEKSRENSELQLLLAEQNARYESELAILQRDNDELEHEKGNLMSRLDELKNDFDRDITAALEGKNIEIRRLQSEILELNNKIENEHTKWQTSMAKVEALEECLRNVRKDPSINITELIDAANVKAQLIEAQRKYKTIKERMESEADSRKLAENQLEIVSAEVEKLKQDFNQSEKDKLEAQTRLEVLSNYFKEKENQLQKELSLKEAMWLKQQGETTTTVDRLTAMQEEIQSLKSQNDSLRAEIEAQIAAHKAQTGTLENRAHETWLAARQSDRRYEEARAEATALRRKLTALAGGNINEGNKPSAGPITLSEDLTNIPSPIHMESPGSPMLGRMPPPPFLPPPFMGPPPPFIGMPPPPPFVPPGEMRPAPLGRIMSPPPQRSGRFSPQHLDYEDYLDYEGTNTWHRHTYSPPPRTYRSLSPTDSRYDYGTERDLMSTYDTETDFSPPPSPRESRRRNGNNSEKSDLSKNTNNAKRFHNKGILSSGSEKSYNSPSHNDTKTKKGSASGKSIV